ncbi:hypothetical protein BGX38DRAFT_1222002, partial [Terfezia claveryi]
MLSHMTSPLPVSLAVCVVQVLAGQSWQLMELFFFWPSTRLPVTGAYQGSSHIKLGLILNEKPLAIKTYQPSWPARAIHRAQSAQ